MSATRCVQRLLSAEVSAITRVTSIRKVLAVLAGVLVVPVAGGAQPVGVRRCMTDTTQIAGNPSQRVTLDTIAPGITYTCLLRPEGPWLLHVATIDLRNRAYVIDGVRAMDRMVGRERVSAMAARLAARGERPMVMINADFFDLGTGEI